MRRSNQAFLIVIIPLAVLVAAPRGAAADDWGEEDEEPYTVETWPTELVRRPLTLAAGMWQLSALANVNLTKGEIAEPVSLAPGASYGVRDRLTAGVSTTQGFCVTGGTACPYLYNDLGGFVRWSAWQQGPWEIALQGALEAQQFQPDFRLDMTLRATGEWQHGFLAVDVEPFVAAGLTDRDRNLTIIGVNGRVVLQATSRVAFYGLVRLFGAVEHFSDTYLIPSGVGVFVGLGRVDLGAQILFPALLGPNDAAFAGLGKLDQREAQVFAAARF
jgi:hypothetical protein